MNKSLLAAALAGAMIGGASYAQTTPDAPPAPERAHQEHKDSGPMTRNQAMAHADKRFDRMDVNRDGKISADELTVGRGKHVDGKPANADADASPAGGGHRMQRMMDRIDTNHDGMISRDEMRAEAGARFDHMDTNHDGAVDENERGAARDLIRARSGGKHHGHHAPSAGEQPEPDTDQ